MKSILNGRIKKSICIICCVAIFSATLFTLGSKVICSASDEESTISVYKDFYKVSEEELKALKEQLGTWDAVSLWLAKEQAASSYKVLTETKLRELYDQGYGLKNIEKARQLSLMSEYTIGEILAAKGKLSPDKKEKSWDTVIKELAIDTRSIEQRLGLSEKTINDLIKKGYTRANVIDAAVLAHNYKKNMNDMLRLLKEGCSREELESRCIKEKVTSQNEYSEEKTKQKVSQNLKKKYGITQDELEKYSEYGINDIQIAVAKEIAAKTGVSYLMILDMRAAGKDWAQINQELEVE